MSAPRFSLPIKVGPEAIDERDHVNNLTYLLWCLMAAEGHWKQVTTPQLQNDFIWYVLHHSIDYKASAFLGESLVVETWVQQITGAKCERHYQIIRPSDKVTLVRAKTVWCLLDAKTVKPVKIPQKICILFEQ
ncbi:MAG: acyl-CoA thioesterase [Gilvibacter sp.]